uniref:Uncharacterized protein n=1 Tax=Anguilla anguilla TaxID=7936 RepID=A0A0E9TN76_ANGAN
MDAMEMVCTIVV